MVAVAEFDRSLNLERAEWTLRFPANLPASSQDWRRDLAAAAHVSVLDRTNAQIESAAREVHRVVTELAPDSMNGRPLAPVQQSPKFWDAVYRLCAVIDHEAQNACLHHWVPVRDGRVECMFCEAKSPQDEAEDAALDACTCREDRPCHASECDTCATTTRCPVGAAQRSRRTA